MIDLMPIYVEAATYQKLQKLAVLAGSEAAAVERLLSHWESGARKLTEQSPAVPARRVWRSPAGHVLPVGERLEARDGGKTHHAVVEAGGIRYAGKLFDSPSAAACAVKEKRGLTGRAASTNGWQFWKIREPSSNRLVLIDALRPSSIDSDALLAELDALPTRPTAG